jgi:hypothetical protein
MLKSYFDDIITALSSYGWIQCADVVRHSLESTDQKDILFYRLRIYLTYGSLLEMMERIAEFRTGDTDTTKYSFHWQDPDGFAFVPVHIMLATEFSHLLLIPPRRYPVMSGKLTHFSESAADQSDQRDKRYCRGAPTNQSAWCHRL